MNDLQAGLDDEAVETGPDNRARRRVGALEDIELQSAVLVRHFELVRRRGDAYANLDRAAYLMLRTLSDSGPTDIGGLAAALGLDRSTAGRQVSTMAAGDLVRCSPDPADRRRSIISPTESGLHAMNEVREQRRCATEELLAAWSEPDLATLSEMFTRYNSTVAERYLNSDQSLPGTTE